MYTTVWDGIMSVFPTPGLQQRQHDLQRSSLWCLVSSCGMRRPVMRFAKQSGQLNGITQSRHNNRCSRAVWGLASKLDTRGSAIRNTVIKLSGSVRKITLQLHYAVTHIRICHEPYYCRHICHTRNFTSLAPLCVRKDADIVNSYRSEWNSNFLNFLTEFTSGLTTHPRGVKVAGRHKASDDTAKLLYWTVNPSDYQLLGTVLGGIVQSVPCNCDHFLIYCAPHLICIHAWFIHRAPWLQHRHLVAEQGVAREMPLNLSDWVSLAYAAGIFNMPYILTKWGRRLRIFIALKSPSSSTGFESANLGSNSKHNNHYATENYIHRIS
jgi:hypothetical protein